MSPLLLTAYVLMWPTIVAGVLFYLISSFYGEWRVAKAENRPMI